MVGYLLVFVDCVEFVVLNGEDITSSYEHHLVFCSIF